MNPLLFFVMMIGLDIFLKSVKDKKKIEESRQKKMQELKKENIKIVKPSETRVKREIQQNPSISKRNKNDFFGEHGLYREDHDGYRERYEDRYKDIEEVHKEIRSGYERKQENQSQSQSLYDPNAIKRSGKKEYDEGDVRNYGRGNQKVDIPVPKASTFKNDVLNGIIFSEILGKPRSMQNKDI